MASLTSINRPFASGPLLILLLAAMSSACGNEDGAPAAYVCSFCGKAFECNSPSEKETLAVTDVRSTERGCSGLASNSTGLQVEVDCQSGQICIGTNCKSATIEGDSLYFDDATCQRTDD
jgi:hypothetical protein